MTAVAVGSAAGNRGEVAVSMRSSVAGATGGVEVTWQHEPFSNFGRGVRVGIGAIGQCPEHSPCWKASCQQEGSAASGGAISATTTSTAAILAILVT